MILKSISLYKIWLFTIWNIFLTLLWQQITAKVHNEFFCLSLKWNLIYLLHPILVSNFFKIILLINVYSYYTNNYSGNIPCKNKVKTIIHCNSWIILAYIILLIVIIIYIHLRNLSTLNPSIDQLFRSFLRN